MSVRWRICWVTRITTTATATSAEGEEEEEEEVAVTRKNAVRRETDGN